jgi:hypothetical protein
MKNYRTFFIGLDFQVYNFKLKDRINDPWSSSVADVTVRAKCSKVL